MDYIQKIMNDLNLNAAASVPEAAPPPREYKRISRNIGFEYSNKSFENYSCAETVKRIKDVLLRAEKPNWIYIHGASRIGKTHLACAAYRHYFDIGVQVDIRRCVALDMLISNYDNVERVDQIEYLCRVDTLILDDIGVGKLTNERHSMYYYIIDTRLCNGRKTIFTSNLPPARLWTGSTDVSPERIISRIQESCIGVEIKSKEQGK